jgi:serine protease AprX
MSSRIRNPLTSGLLVSLVLSGAVAVSSGISHAATARVIVGYQPGHAKEVQGAISRHGGRHRRNLTALDITIADVPQSELKQLAKETGITSISINSGMSLRIAGGSGKSQADANRSAVSVDGPRSRGITGQGVDVAVIDSGVSPVPGLAGRIINAPDFSADATNPNVAGLDAYGHGTHIAGLIAGNDPSTGFTGLAPASRIVNVKVATHDGTTTVENVLSGINWVISNANKGMNIRVINLSLGVDTDGTYVGDPLAQAVEKAWSKEIVVVVAAGNGGAATSSLESPAVSPYVLAVAAEDSKATADKADDVIADFSNSGSTARTPDLVAPGVGMVSLRVPGSALDDAFPEARVDGTLFRGNGTSQAAAVTSGVAAMLLQSNPKLTADQVKALLVSTANPIPGVAATRQGRGRLDIAAALAVAVPDAKQVAQKWETAGKIDLKKLDKLNSKAKDGKTSKSIEASQLTGNRWTGNRWTGNRWTGNRWTGSGWG